MELRIDASDKDLKWVNSEIRRALREGIYNIVVENASHIHGLACGLKEGNIVVEGDVGDYVAALNDGASITIRGDAGRFLADNMTRGTVVVRGDVGYGCGVYSYGGKILVDGDSGDLLGGLNKGAIIVVTGDSGNGVGTYMVGGEIIILGDVGEKVGDWIIRGSIYLGGAYRSLGNNCREVAMDSEDVRRLREYFRSLGLEEDPRDLKKLVPVSTRPFYGR